jgi:uncharacterized SAM-binding protein YcdF (DUF218 family)
MKGLAALLVVLLVWAAGLMAFADRVARLTPADDPPPADGIVALTGASDLRLEAATRLLEDGKGKRLLVSGVNRKTRRADVLSVTGAAKRTFDCCIDLGYTAADTIGNGRESAQWAHAMGYHSLILVTADYHMPRAMLEMRAALPQIRLTAYPIATPALDAHHWRDSSEGARRMAVEYCKYLVILTREAVLKAGPAAVASPKPPS